MSTMMLCSRATQRQWLHIHRQRGMSLVELMVGVAIGLFIVAAATLMVGNQLSDNRRLLMETQLQQDMRATMDIITRQIRRSGTRRLTPAPGLQDDSPSLLASTLGQPGNFDPEYTGIGINVAKDEITFDYFLNISNDDRLLPGTAETNWGFKLADGRVKTRLIDDWQDLTDASTVKVTGFRIDESVTNSEAVACPKLCPDGTTACWPKTAIRTYTITLQAESASDPLVKRSMQAVARVRNNLPVFNANSTSQPCPP